MKDTDAEKISRLEADLKYQRGLIDAAVALLRKRPGGCNWRPGRHTTVFRYDSLVSHLGHLLDPDEVARVPVPSDLITLDEAALLWGRSRGAINTRISAGRLKVYKCKGHIKKRVSYSEVVRIKSLRHYVKLTEAGARLAREIAACTGKPQKTRDEMVAEIHKRFAPFETNCYTY